jgi:hypothetical protein
MSNCLKAYVYTETYSGCSRYYGFKKFLFFKLWLTGNYCTGDYKFISRSYSLFKSNALVFQEKQEVIDLFNKHQESTGIPEITIERLQIVDIITENNPS